MSSSMVIFLVFTLVSLVPRAIASTKPDPVPQYNYSETNPALQSYQDAWAFVSSNESFVMSYRNFNTNPNNETLTDCVKATKIKEDDQNFTVVHRVTYYNLTACQTYAFNKSYAVINSTGYTTRNVLEGTIVGSNFTEFYPFAFSNEECAIIRKPSWNNGTGKACELWKFESALNKSTTCCDFVFDLLCDRDYKQVTYNTSFCNSINDSTSKS